MTRKLTFVTALSLVAGPVLADDVECLGYRLSDPAQRVQLADADDAWTLYNLGPSRVVIHSTDGILPGPAPHSDQRPVAFVAKEGQSYALGLEGYGLAIVYVCPGKAQ